MRRDQIEAEDRLQRLADRVDRLLELVGENTAKAEAATRAIELFRLDYHGLYEKVRSNLAKLAKRDRDEAADDGGPTALDQITKARQALISRKLSRKE